MGQFSVAGVGQFYIAVNTLIVDKAIATEMEVMFEQDFEHAVPIDPESLDEKLIWWHLGVNLSRLAAPVL
ncbi:MAG: hypothetical protein WBO73_10285 [Gammaproteobacteria bacterium]